MGNLCKGGLDNPVAILKYLEHMTSIGAKEIKLNELQSSPDYFVDFEKVLGTQLSSPYAKGCQRYMRLEGFKFLLKRSCFFVEESKKAHFNDLLKVMYLKNHPKKNRNGFVVLYEDGQIYNGWMKESQAI